MSALLLPTLAGLALGAVLLGLAWLWDRRQERKRREARERWYQWMH